jgi:hypothetical protein
MEFMKDGPLDRPFSIFTHCPSSAGNPGAGNAHPNQDVEEADRNAIFDGPEARAPRLTDEAIPEWA